MNKFSIKKLGTTLRIILAGSGNPYAEGLSRLIWIRKITNWIRKIMNKLSIKKLCIALSATLAVLLFVELSNGYKNGVLLADIREELSSGDYKAAGLMLGELNRSTFRFWQASQLERLSSRTALLSMLDSTHSLSDLGFPSYLKDNMQAPDSDLFATYNELLLTRAFSEILLKPRALLDDLINPTFEQTRRMQKAQNRIDLIGWYQDEWSREWSDGDLPLKFLNQLADESLNEGALEKHYEDLLRTKKESLVKPTITLAQSPFDVVSQLEYSASELASAYNKENRNETYGDHGTILHIIAKTKTEVAYYEAVFEQEPDINMRDKDGATPLILFVTSATEPSATGVLYEFKQNQANFDIKDHSGKTALSYAIQNEDKALVQDLLNYGASANILDLQGQSELEKLLISKTEDDPIVDLLIHRDANYGEISYSSYLAIKAEKLRIDELRVAKENVVEVAPEQPPDYTKAEKRYAKADEKYIKGLNLYNIAIESARRKGGSINTTALPYLNNARKQFKIIFEAKIDPASREMRQRALGRAIHCYKIVLPLTVDSGSRRKMQKELLELQSSQ
ncbi:MAG: ankyrin repeat domain-containing protein [Gammaproteobacteria bacterium]|nr:ankyrin repeat domain-containing protein [Gammaproteobacteria bacterium]